MDRLESLRLFIRIVELSGFGRAADDLNIPRATATHAMKALEARLGTRLLERTTRQVRPTLDGQAYYERCIQVLSELDEAESLLRNDSARPRGTLRVDMNGTHATRIVLPRLGDFHARFPRIDLVLSSGDRLVDLVREGVDCVIRAGAPRDSSLVVRSLASMPQVICASPAYLAAVGVPANPSDLVSHQAVRFFASGGGIDYSFELLEDEVIKSYDLGGWLSVNDAENYVLGAVHSCGLIQLPRWHVEGELRNGQLVEVLTPWTSPPMALSAMYPQRRHLSPRVRVFVDWIAEIYAAKFGASPAEVK